MSYTIFCQVVLGIIIQASYTCFGDAHFDLGDLTKTEVLLKSLVLWPENSDILLKRELSIVQELATILT